MSQSLAPEQKILFHLMKGAAPERTDEIKSLWKKYNPKVVIADDQKGITMNANKSRIKFDKKTIDIFWLVGFSGWLAIECYCPLILCSVNKNIKISELIQIDEELPEIERAYRERLAAAQSLKDANVFDRKFWPIDIPLPNNNRDQIEDNQYKVAFDLTCLSCGFIIFHEFRHVMLDFDSERPRDRREEELACDVWAREFMTVKIERFAKPNSHKFWEVLQKRSMGFVLAALILDKITPFGEWGGNKCYFSVADRITAILDNTNLSENSHFWVQAASTLLGIIRQKNESVDFPVMPPRELTEFLLAKL